MSKIINLDGHLVCMFDEETGAIEIRRKGCITLIYWDASGNPIVLNSKA